MKITKATTETALENIEKLYLQAFPEVERKPWKLLLEKQAEGTMELFSLEDEKDTFLGLAIMAYDQDLVLLDYFAVSGDRRGQGIGSAAITALQNHFKGKPADDLAVRKSRKGFYLRNGLHPMDFDVNLFGVEMEILSNCESLNYEEYLNIYVNACGPEYADKISLIPRG